MVLRDVDLGRRAQVHTVNLRHGHVPSGQPTRILRRTKVHCGQMSDHIHRTISDRTRILEACWDDDDWGMLGQDKSDGASAASTALTTATVALRPTSAESSSVTPSAYTFDTQRCANDRTGS